MYNTLQINLHTFNRILKRGISSAKKKYNSINKNVLLSLIIKKKKIVSSDNLAINGDLIKDKKVSRPFQQLFRTYRS